MSIVDGVGGRPVDALWLRSYGTRMGGLTEIKSPCGAVADEALRIPESWLIEMLR